LSSKGTALISTFAAIITLGRIMPTAPDNHDAHDYAERIRERLPRRLQELRERCGLSKYGLARESGISRVCIGRIERVVMHHENKLSPFRRFIGRLADPCPPNPMPSSKLLPSSFVTGICLARL
jgi:DNA-binding XRE family transcriptional regulator